MIQTIQHKGHSSQLTGIYRVINPKGCVYIGMTRNYHNRMVSYQKVYCKLQTRLYNSLKKYTPELHRFELINILPNDISDKDLINSEKVYINAYRDSGYEMLNLIMSDRANTYHALETRQKISNAQKGRIPWNKGVPQTEEQRLKNSQSHIGIVNRKGYKLPEDLKKRISEKLKGQKLSDQTKEKLRISSTGRLHTNEAKLKMSKAAMGNKKMLGKKHSAETIEKIRQKNIGRTNPKLMGENNPAKRDDVREKIRQSKIIYWANKKLNNANRNNNTQK